MSEHTSPFEEVGCRSQRVGECKGRRDVYVGLVMYVRIGFLGNIEIG